MNKNCFFIYVLFLIFFISACSDDKEEEMLAPVISGLENKYTVLEGEELELRPTVANDNAASYTWLQGGKEVATTLIYTFKEEVPGEYNLVLNVINKAGNDQREISVTVVKKDSPPVISGPEEMYIMEAGSELRLNPVVVSDSEVTYSWILEEQEVSTGKEYVFNTSQPGKYKLLLKVTNKQGTTEKEITIIVNGESPNIETVVHTIVSMETPAYLAGSEKLQWELLNASSELYRFSYTNSKTPLFIAAQAGEYQLQVTDGEIKSRVKVIVKRSEKELSPYISNVFDYLPAPGQFVNILPDYKQGDTHADMIKKANEWLVGEDAWMITLGGWGGYVTFGFDHTIVNVSGKRDFRVNGNAFGANYGRPGAPFGGSCEPGIVMVAYDKNKNGKPDEDEWYEIKGSSNFSAEKEAWYSIATENKNDTRVFRDYEMTYYKPTKEEPEIIGEPDNPTAYMTIEKYIRWKDNKNNTGYKVKNVYHQQTYYPA